MQKISHGAPKRPTGNVSGPAYDKAERRIAEARSQNSISLDLRIRTLTQIPPLEGLTSLQTLDLSGTNISNISPLSNLSSLRLLNLTGTRVSDFSPLAGHQALETINMRDAQISQLASFPPLAALKVLSLTGSQIDDISWLAQLSSLQTLNLSRTLVSDITPISSVATIHSLNLAHTKVTNLAPLAGLSLLKVIDLSRTQVSNLAPLAKLTSLQQLYLTHSSVSGIDALSGLTALKILTLSETKVCDLSPLSKLRALKSLYLANSKVSDLAPIANLTKLQSLDLRGTRVTDVSPLAGLVELQWLDLCSTWISDFDPLASVTSLINGAQKHSHQGLAFTNSVLPDQQLHAFAKLNNPERTIKTVNYLRQKQGLAAYEPPSEVYQETDLQEAQQTEPMEGVPAPFDYALNSAGKIAVAGSISNLPLFPSQRSRKHHAQRLEACRVHASDLLEELEQANNVRTEYLVWTKKYLSRLPTATDDGNILLADAAVRSLRNMFAAESDVLPTPLASQLKTLLENYMGLRAFYPEVAAFQQDVREGRVTEPLSLDAVEGFTEAVSRFTPQIFDDSVPASLESTAETPAAVPDIPPEDRQRGPHSPTPPPDMMADVDPGKAHDLAQASTLNSLWRVIKNGAEIHKNVDAWTGILREVAPFAQAIVQYLRNFF